ncbi:peptidoglycan/xylan/chitin deacetylase (PgdA/CDA1 family) [Catenuloplanes nepalensis]|uniref:Peptidoglycan/xylan/chitin deacetylase (PgdA/CDA1 family) n=1 Tax=Catenuloplanes nepalensis TaxID=587533 RepID=A0ABT9MYS1_9ACTN|nr:polysaccharide deacetylase family protein [Catenuloplanes nepalensis]MDP9796398.1 peptidoglycan/xylan/chitin deacetylase (PgdA/CDA1 family) [Catenuloplanes nepalensis]
MTRWMTDPRRIAFVATFLAVALIAGLVVVARMTSGSHAAFASPYRPNPRSAVTPEQGGQAQAAAPRGPMRAEPPTRQRAYDGPDGTQRVTGTPSMSLTFDDGPSQFTDEVLDQLSKHGIKATFCVIGSQVRSHAAQMRRIVAEGHTLCNHTWNHDFQLGDRTPEQIVKDMVRTNDAIHTVVPNAPVRYFRNPGGNFNHRTVSVAQNLGMVPLHWTIDSRDWESKDSKKICDLVEANASPGAVVLLHDGGGDRRETMKALKKLLPFLKDRFDLVAMP